MFRGVRLAWAKAKALSVLQEAFEMPLREPLGSLDDLDLKQVTALTLDADGNAFDAAVAFMTYRIKAALEAEIATGNPVVDGLDSDRRKLSLGYMRVRHLTKFGDLHTDRVLEVSKLGRQVDARKGVPP